MVLAVSVEAGTVYVNTVMPLAKGPTTLPMYPGLASVVRPK